MLHKTSKVRGYHLHADDGAIGHVDDFLYDESWGIKYIDRGHQQLDRRQAGADRDERHHEDRFAEQADLREAQARGDRARAFG